MHATDPLIRVGLIGYGYAGKTFHGPSIRSVPGLSLSVIGSSNAARVHADFPDAEVCPPADVPTHPQVDLVVVATPNQSHHPLAAAALAAGKHVVVDKPFTLDLAEARSLRDIARRHNRLLSVFHNRRWESEVLGAQAILASGSLGDVTHFECHMDRYRPIVRRRWREEPGPGAGLWFDLGPHLIDLALFLFGLPDTLSASLAILRDGGSTDDWAHLQLKYPRRRVVLHSTLLAAAPGPRTVIHGTRASWVKYGQDVQEAQLQRGMLPTDPAFGIDPDPGILYDGATGEETRIPAPRGHQQDYYAGVRDAILGRAPLPVTPRDAVAVMAILETSFESAKRGQVLPLPLTAEERSEWE